MFDDEIMNVEKLESFTSYGKINSYSSKTVLLAIGSKRESLKISGMERFEGSGVSYCVTCDGFLYRKKRVGIVGDGDYMLHELESLKRFCPAENITVFSQGKELELDGIKQVKSKITSLEGKERLETVVVGNERYEIDGLFVAVGSAGGVEFAKKIGIEYSDGILTTDENCMTSLDGLYAAGDCKNKLKQISTAVADGTVAAMAIIKKTRRR